MITIDLHQIFPTSRQISMVHQDRALPLVDMAEAQSVHYLQRHFSVDHDRSQQVVWTTSCQI